MAGKSQTQFNWDTVPRLEALRVAGAKLRPGDPIPEPPLWFHDIFRVDGSPFDASEVVFIKAQVGRRSCLPLFPAAAGKRAQQSQMEQLLQSSLESKVQQTLLPRLLGSLQRVQRQMLQDCGAAQKDSAAVRRDLQHLREDAVCLDQTLFDLRSLPNPT